MKEQITPEEPKSVEIGLVTFATRSQYPNFWAGRYLLSL